MIGSLILSLLVGLILGFVINLLADILPAYRARAVEDENDGADPLVTEEHEPPHRIEADDPVEDDYSERWSYRRLISPRYIVVNLLMIALTAYVWSVGTQLPTISALFYLSVFALIAVIDIEHRLILTAVMLPAFVLAFVELAISGRLSFPDAMVGYGLGQILVMLIYLFSGVFLWLRNMGRSEPIREIAFGFGDVTLATYCGLVVGYPGVVYMVILAIILGGAIGLLFLIHMAIVRRYEANRVMPYGPAIVMAAAILLLWGDRVAYYLMGGR